MAHRTSDHRRHRLSVPDARALLRLTNDLHETAPAGEARKLKMVEAVRELTAADRASAAVATFNGGSAGSAPAVVSMVHAEPQVKSGAGSAGQVGCAEFPPWNAYLAAGRRWRRGEQPSVDWCTLAAFASTTPASGSGAQSDSDAGMNAAEHCIHSFLPLSGGHVVACLTVARSPTRPTFSLRAR